MAISTVDQISWDAVFEFHHSQLGLVAAINGARSMGQVYLVKYVAVHMYLSSDKPHKAVCISTCRSSHSSMIPLDPRLFDVLKHSQR